MVRKKIKKNTISILTSGLGACFPNHDFTFTEINQHFDFEYFALVLIL